jgi:RNA polymerase primary sigma factor
MVTDRYNETGDSLQRYMQEIGKTPLLTREEENQLAAQVRRGNKRARERMIKANLRLVVKISYDYANFGMPLLDLINEGNIGLMKAVERFDPAKGRLATYGSCWIKQSIKRALANQSKTIRLPVHMVEKVAGMRRTAVSLREELGREPTNEELGEEMGVTARRVALMRSATLQPTSLDAPLWDGDSTDFWAVIKDEAAGTPYDDLDAKTFKAMILDLVNALPRREAAILRARFGLDGEPEQTLEEIGRHLGVTRERIRQLKDQALATLRRMIEKLETTAPRASRKPALAQPPPVLEYR